MDMRVSNIQMIYGVNSSQKSNYDRAGRAEEKKDMVAISGQAKDFQSIKNALKSVSDVRPEKVSLLKEKVESNNYFIHPWDVANKMVNQIFK